MYRILATIIMAIAVANPNLLCQAPPGSGHCLKFSGNNYVSLGSAFNNVSLPISVAVWFKPDANSQDHPIFYSHTAASAYTGFSFQVIGGYLAISFGDGTRIGHFARRTAKTPVNLQAGRWYHLAGVIHSATQMDIYINGVKMPVAYDGTGLPVMYTNSTSGFIGRTNRVNQANNYLNGEVDELVIWNTAISQQKVRDQMCVRMIGTHPNLLGCYHFDNTSGSTVVNSASSTNGTLQNSPARVLSGAPLGDRSLYIYNQGSMAIPTFTADTVQVFTRPNSGNGTHVYLVDQLTPPNQQQNLNQVPGVNHYFGVFNSDTVSDFDIVYKPNNTLRNSFTSEVQLAKRPNNASNSWTPEPPRNNPLIKLNKESGGQWEYSLHYSPCPPAPFFLGNDTAICTGAPLVLSPKLPMGFNYLWNTGDTSLQLTVSKSGNYWLQAIDSSGCKFSDTINVIIMDSTSGPDLLPADTLICNIGSVSFSAHIASAVSYRWNSGQSTPEITVTQGGKYIVTIQFAGGCTVKDSMQVRFSVVADALEKDDYIICPSGSIDFNLDGTKFQIAQWNNGTTGLSATYTSAGLHWVLVSNIDGCTVVDTFRILAAKPLSEKTIFSDTSFCFNEKLTLFAPDTLEVQWPDGSDTSFTVYSGGFVKANLSDGCTMSQEQFEVQMYDCDCKVYFANAFKPDGDGLNDIFKAEAECDFTKYRLEVYDRFGKRVFRSLNPEVGFDGTYRGKQLALGVYTYYFEYSTPATSGKRRGYFTLLR